MIRLGVKTCYPGKYRWFWGSGFSLVKKTNHIIFNYPLMLLVCCLLNVCRRKYCNYNVIITNYLWLCEFIVFSAVGGVTSHPHTDDCSALLTIINRDYVIEPICHMSRGSISDHWLISGMNPWTHIGYQNSAVVSHQHWLLMMVTIGHLSSP